jgi:2-haloacid dehalogenase
MTHPTIRAVIFDAYGTLLDVHSAMAAHAARVGPAWATVSADWRTRQLEYTWIAALTGRHRDFAAITDESLRIVALRHGIDDPALLADIAASYRRLAAYPEVAECLADLRARGIACAILSNGTPDMLAEAVGAAGIAPLLDDVLSIEAAGVYKPDPRVYALATARFACEPGELLFVSSNGWDAYGATVFGCRVAWVNRAGGPAEYGLEQSATILPDLAGLARAL